jgi:teichuronic acid biosynthesis glycosyltransferase TuaG
MIKVSVIMPCFNGYKYIEDAVNSVIKQTFQDWELIIIDNNSTDNSSGIIERLVNQDARIIKLVCHQKGAGFARNFGIQEARGRYIAFLDCDDLWSSEKLDRQIHAMQSNKAVFSWTSYQVIDPVGRHIRNQLADNQISYDLFMSKRSIVGCLTVVYDSVRLGKLFMPTIKMRQDYALWARIIRISNERKYTMIGLGDVLASYRIHDEALTKNKLRAAIFQWSFYRDEEKLSLLITLRFMFYYLMRAFIDRRKSISN